MFQQRSIFGQCIDRLIQRQGRVGNEDSSFECAWGVEDLFAGHVTGNKDDRLPGELNSLLNEPVLQRGRSQKENDLGGAGRSGQGRIGQRSPGSARISPEENYFRRWCPSFASRVKTPYNGSFGERGNKAHLSISFPAESEAARLSSLGSISAALEVRRSRIARVSRNAL